jgi:hypothetical protein
LLLPPLFEKSGCKTINVIHQQDSGQVPANFQAEKSKTVIPGLVSVQYDFAVRAAASVQDFKWRGRHKDDPPAALFARYCHNGLVFACQKVKTELVGISLSQENIKRSRDGVILTIAK